MSIEYCPQCERDQPWRSLGGGVQECPGCKHLFGLYNRRTHQHKGHKRKAVKKPQPEIVQISTES